VNQVILGLLHELDLSITSQVITPTFIQYIVSDLAGISLKVDLVKDIPVHFGSLVSRDHVRLDNLENIGSNKVLAVFGRTDARDFIDLFLQLFHELRKSKTEEMNQVRQMTLEFLREIKKEIK
jgi:hypothetical protein